MKPILFHIFGMEVISYGFALGVSFLAVLTLATLRSRLESIEPYLVLDAFLWLFIGAILGSRLMLVIQNPAHTLLDPWYIFRIWKGGFSSFGGLIGGGLILIIFLKIKRKPVFNFLDLVSPYLGLGFAIQKILGCLLVGCCYGKPSDLPWAIVFDQTRSVIPSKYLGVPLHPAQIYEGLLGLGIFILLAFFRDRADRKTPQPPAPKRPGPGMATVPSPREAGKLFFLFALIFSGGRFLTEFFRGDQVQKILGLFGYSQAAFGISFLLVLVVYYLKFKGKKTYQGNR